MQTLLAQKPSKSHAILSSIEDAIAVGQLVTGSKLQSMRTFSKQFSTSVATVQYAFNKLEMKGLIERRAGAGVFVKTPQINCDQTITFLVPYSNFFMSSDQSGIMARRMYMGMCDTLSLDKVKLLPVSQAATIALETIDYPTLEQINPGSTVVIEGVWYSKLFPFFAERNINGIFIGDVSEKAIALEHNYCSLLNNRRGAIEDAVCYLANLGYQRIAVLTGGDKIDLHGTFMSGYQDGLRRSSLAYDSKLVTTFQTKKIFPRIDHQYFKKLIAELWQASKFDAILLSIPDISTTIAGIIQHDLGLKIPDDVGLMTVHDRMDHINFPVPITAIEFPWYDIGIECHKLLNNRTTQPHSTQFNGTIIERESTRKGAGSFANTKLLPEYNNLRLAG